MKYIKQFDEHLTESTLYKKGDELTIDMGDGPEQVTVLSDFSAGASKTSFITLKRDKGAPYTITLGKLNSVLVSESYTINEKEYDIYSEVEHHLNEIYLKLTLLHKKTTDPNWKKSLSSILNSVEKLETQIGNSSSKLGVIPTNESKQFYTAKDIIKIAKNAGNIVIDAKFDIEDLVTAYGNKVPKKELDRVLINYDLNIKDDSLMEDFNEEPISLDESILKDVEKQLVIAPIGSTATGGGYGPFQKTHKNTWKNLKTGSLQHSESLSKQIGSFKDFKIN